MPVIQSPGHADMPQRNSGTSREVSVCTEAWVTGDLVPTQPPPCLSIRLQATQGSHKNRQLKVWARDNVIKEIIKDAVEQ